MLSTPATARPRRSGKLNVVEPSPAPYVVPTMANSAAYVDLDTAAPEHRSHPEGAVDPAYGETTPDGTPTTPPTADCTNSVVAICVVLVPPVAVGAVGVPVRAGLAERTLDPVPVDAVTPVPPLATGSVPVTPVVKGRLVPLVRITADGVPRFGVVRTGDVDKTTFPVPVDVVTPVPPLATGRVPVTPVVKGRPVAFVRVAAEGVPMFGVVRTGEEDKTTLPVPVDVVTPVPPFATGRVPVTPVVKGSPVAFVKVAAEGVPRLGVVRVGDVERTTLPDPVDVVTPVPPRATERVPVVPATIGSPVALVKVAADGVPRFGVTSVGDVARTTLPEPVDVDDPVPPSVTGTGFWETSLASVPST
jgi:hypothetical protein